MRIRAFSLFFLSAAVVAGVMLGLASGSGTQAQEPETLPSEVQLFPGTNHVAYGGPSMAVGDALTNVADDVSSIWFFDNSVPSSVSPWKLWSRGLPSALQGFTELIYGNAYFVQSAREAAWVFAEGDLPPLPTSIALRAGGNSIVYVGPTEFADVSVGLGSGQLRNTQAGSLDIRRIFRLTRGAWDVWAPTLPTALLGFDTLEFGRAYFVIAGAAGLWSFGPPQEQDFGDAPDGDDAEYPIAVTATFPSRLISNGARIANPGVDNLGTAVSAEFDANVVNVDEDDDGLVGMVITILSIPPPAALEVDVTIDAAAPGGQRFLNVLMDLDMDGNWGGAAAGGEPEWVIMNYAQAVTPGGTVRFTPPAFAFGHGARLPEPWIRIALTREPITASDWDGSGSWEYGEIEDYHVLLSPPDDLDPPLPPPPPKPLGVLPVMSCPAVVDMTGQMMVDFDCTITNVNPFVGGDVFYDMIYQVGNVTVVPAGVRLGPVALGAAGFPFFGIPGGGPAAVTLTFKATKANTPAHGQYRYRARTPDPEFLLVAGLAIPQLLEQEELPVDFTDALPPSHTVIAQGSFFGGDYEGSCSAPPLAGFSDEYEITVEGDVITIFQPSTGDLGVGTVFPDGTFRTESLDGEIYEGIWGDDWSLWGINIYPVTSFCDYIWEFHMEPEVLG